MYPYFYPSVNAVEKPCSRKARLVEKQEVYSHRPLSSPVHLVDAQLNRHRLVIVFEVGV